MRGDDDYLESGAVCIQRLPGGRYRTVKVVSTVGAQPYEIGVKRLESTGMFVRRRWARDTEFVCRADLEREVEDV